MILARRLLKHYRIKQGYSITELAKRLNKTTGTLSAIENRKAYTSPGLAKDISSILNTSFDILFEILEETNEIKET